MLRLNKSIIELLFKRSLCTFTSKNVKNNEYLDISEEVKYGLNLGKPVVALESTIVTHGMPYPENLKCALEVDQIVREQGAIPATIGILNGKIKVGLSKNELEYLADTKKNKAVKTTRRDLVYVIGNKLNGGTTVSGTIIIAERAGIPIFVTGGIGGVHRQGEKTFDISADLTELGRNHITVISSGVKSILDIPKTLEYLETQGVFVATYGPTNEFPAFYTRHSGIKTTYNVTNPQDAAMLIATSLKLSLNSGNLIAVPVPEEFSFESNKINAAIEEALLKADESDISGKELTPFLLRYISDITSGRSLETNIALIKNNAKIGGQIAVSLSELLNAEPSKTSKASKESVSDKKICKEPVSR